MLVYFMTIWNNLWPFGIIYIRLVYIVCGHLLYFPNLECLDQEKSGNPGRIARQDFAIKIQNGAAIIDSILCICILDINMYCNCINSQYIHAVRS
jgi:hypothetical protein